MTRTTLTVVRFVCLAAVCGLLHSALIPPAAAQEVEWRPDYATARHEASAKNRPLVIDFGTENCFWCKKLDAITFKDPAVANLMNERFVPLRIDAEREAQLAAQLQIESYPTVVIADAAGHILDLKVGFIEAPAFLDKLQRVLANLTPPPQQTVTAAKPQTPPPAAPGAGAAPAEQHAAATTTPAAPAPSPATPAPAAPAAVASPDWMERDYLVAAKAIASSDYPRALALLKSITEDGQKRPVQVKARDVLKTVEEQAAGRMARAKQLVEKGQTTEAMETLTELVRTFAGTQAAAEGGKMLTGLGETQEARGKQRGQHARELLAQAREDYRGQQYVSCLNRCDVLTNTFSDLPEGLEALQLATEIKNNPDWMRSACDVLSDQLGMLYLSLAETWLKKGQPEQAVICLERVIHTLPGTRQAEAAQVRLAQIQGQPPTRPVDFKKP